jgi:hypothetical protein
MIVRKPSETYPFLNLVYIVMISIILDLISNIIILESICKTDDYYIFSA